MWRGGGGGGGVARDALGCVVGREEFLSTRSRCSVVVSQSCEQDKCARVKWLRQQTTIHFKQPPVRHVHDLAR